LKKKPIINSILLIVIVNLLCLTVNIGKVDAATTAIVNPYNNQLAVNAKADRIIQTAKYFIGRATYATSSAEVSTTYPYKFRCASFINYIFEYNGVDLATSDENNMIQQGYFVPKDQLQKGDLVFFDSTPADSDPTNHVGLYIGDNKIIHMASSKLNVVISDLNSTSYYRNYYKSARRVLPSLLAANPATRGDKIVATSFGLQDKVTISSTTNNATSMTFTNGGLVNYIFMKNGIDLGTNNIKDQMKLGKAVSKSNLQKGDLVFFNNVTGSTNPGMVGIYAGDHRLILCTPSNGIFTRVDLLDYYEQHYITARRVW
jgi:Cell wall-associated hydrolases (invasion-associated proteins)